MMPQEKQSISINIVRDKFALLMDHLEQETGEKVDLTSDYFWSIDPSFKYDVTREPPSEGLTIGQLSESWSNVLKIEPADVVSFGLVWIGQILAAIGEEVVR
jgi:hypothetical protein